MAINVGGIDGGYRAPAKVQQTIKALQDRQKLAAQAAARATEIPQQIANPWQGVAHLTHILGTGLEEGRAQTAEAGARDQLSQIMAKIDPNTGATQEQIAAMQRLDPEFAAKEYERAMAERAAVRNREDTQQFTTQERLGAQQFTGGQQQEQFKHADTAAETLAKTQEAAAVEADKRQVAQKAADAATATDKDLLDAALRNDSAPAVDEAVRRKLMTPEEGAQRKEAIRIKDMPAQIGAVPPDIAKARGGDVAAHPERYQFNSQTQEVTPVQKAQSPADYAAVSGAESNLINTRGTLKSLQEALDLAPNVYESGPVFNAEDYANNILKTKGHITYAPETIQKATDTQRYYNIMGKEAILSMSETLKGASSDRDVQQFMNNMANPTIPNGTKKQMIQDMMAKVRAHEARLTRQVGESGGDVNAGADLNQPTAPPPPAPPTGTDADPLEQARKAIAAGADRAAVIKRLQDNGIDATGL